MLKLWKIHYYFDHIDHILWYRDVFKGQPIKNEFVSTAKAEFSDNMEIAGFT